MTIITQTMAIVSHPEYENCCSSGLRGADEQALLAELAGCPGIHFVATVDHINAPLLWDVKTRAALNWLCHDATTFAPYFAETLDMPPVLMGEALMPTS